MKNEFSFGTIERPLIGVVAESSGIALSVVENLLSNFCRVNIYSTNPDIWKKASSHLENNKKLFVKNFSELGQDDDESLIFFSIAFSNYDNFQNIDKAFLEKRRLEELRKLVGKNNLNIFYILSYAYNPASNHGIEKVYQSVLNSLTNSEKVIFLGQLIGKRMLMTERDPVSKMFKDAVSKGEISYPEGIYLYPTTISDSSKYIIKLLFSFGLKEESISILGPRLRAADFAKILKRTLRANFLIRPGGKEVFLLGNAKSKKIVSNIVEIRKAIKDASVWYKERKIPFIEKIIPPVIKPHKLYKHHKPDKLRKKIRKRKPLNLTKIFKQYVFLVGKKLRQIGRKKKGIRLSLIYLVLIFFIIFLPLISTGVSLGLAFNAEKRVSGGDMVQLKEFLNLVNRVSGFSTKLNEAYLRTPYVGNVYLMSQQASKMTYIASDCAISFAGIAEDSLSFMSAVLKGGNVSTEYIQPLSLNLDILYRKLGFLQNEMKGVSPPLLKYLGKYLSLDYLQKTRETVLFSRGLIENFDDVLGIGGEKRYLVLFQNNMELRPGGGFIGAFALVDFRDGKLSGFNVYDVHSADDQLKGYVKPPEPIEKYLNQTVWYLRDSNWDPDFPSSAEKAEWFLDKEMDIPVDGVFAVDLNFIRDFVNISGPIHLLNSDREVNFSNLFDVAQLEIEGDSSSGLRKKVNFLSDVARGLLLDLNSIEKEKYLSLVKVVYKSLQERHIQLFFHSDKVAQKMKKIKWDGSLTKPRCESGDCFSDLISLVEANLGVNKATYFIKRDVDIKVLISSDKIEKELNLVLKNNANPALGDRGKYRTYIRLFVPKDAVFESVKISGLGNNLYLDPDIKIEGNFVEAGVFVEVNPGERKNIRYVWQIDRGLNFEGNGEYKLLVRKQAGVEGYNAKIKVLVPPGFPVGVRPKPLLTRNGEFEYNAYLTTDFRRDFFW